MLSRLILFKYILGTNIVVYSIPFIIIGGACDSNISGINEFSCFSLSGSKLKLCKFE